MSFILMRTMPFSKATETISSLLTFLYLMRTMPFSKATETAMSCICLRLRMRTMPFNKATETNMPRLTGCRAINVIVCQNRHRRDENYAARWGKYAIDVRKIEIINLIGQ